MLRSYKLTRRSIIKVLGGFGVVGGLRQSDAQANGQSTKTTQEAKAGNSQWLTLPPTPTLPGTPRKGIATINGTNIFYAQFGQGRPVLLLHGGLANSNYWGHQVEHLAESFLVIVMDTRGHGRSSVMSPSFSYSLFAEDTVGLLDFLEISQAAIVGWSDGAVTGLQLAMTKPSRVSKLFAFGANSSADGLKANGARSPTFVTFARRCHTEYALLSPHPERCPLPNITGSGAPTRLQLASDRPRLNKRSPPTVDVSVGTVTTIRRRAVCINAGQACASVLDEARSACNKTIEAKPLRMLLPRDCTSTRTYLKIPGCCRSAIN